MNLQRALEASGYRTRSYSGRGMFGKECLATQVAGIGDIFLCGSKIGRIPDATDTKLMPRCDTMGYEIILYWPDIPYEPEAAETESGQHDDDDREDRLDHEVRD